MNIELRHKLVLEVIVSFLLLGFYAFMYLNAETLIEAPLFASVNPVFFPKTIILCTVAFCTLLVIDTVKMMLDFRKGIVTHAMKMLVIESEDEYPIIKVVLYVATLFLYLIGFYYLGFVYATPIIILLVARLLGMQKIVIPAIAAVAFTIALDYASLHLLQIMLPTGALFG